MTDEQIAELWELHCQVVRAARATEQATYSSRHTAADINNACDAEAQLQQAFSTRLHSFRAPEQ